MSTYEPGTVAVATVDGKPNVRVTLDPNLNWFSHEEVSGRLWHGPEIVTNIRPLVVLDIRPDRLSLIRDLIECARVGDLRVGIGTDLDELADMLVDQIAAQTKPRIPEPGLWGVVEAHTDGNHDRRQFGRISEKDEQHWLESDAMGWFLWDDLIDPVLVRDGIEDAS